MRMDGRLDGHLVQGHVDVRAECIRAEERSGSWNFHFRYPAKDPSHITVAKGSITVNGVSLTVVESRKIRFRSPSFPTPSNTPISKPSRKGLGESGIRHLGQVRGPTDAVQGFDR